MGEVFLFIGSMELKWLLTLAEPNNLTECCNEEVAIKRVNI